MEDSNRTSRLRLVVAEDDSGLRDLLGEILTEAGHSVELARNGAEAITWLGKGTVDVLITDIIMPEREGFETIVQARKNYPQVRILAISGGGRLGPENYLPTALALGVDATLAKPFDKDTLLAILAEMMRHPVKRFGKAPANPTSPK